MTDHNYIPAEQLSAYDRWELPVIKAEQREKALRMESAPAAVEKTEASKRYSTRLPTLEEIESIRQSAHDEGLSHGYAEGFERGQSRGLEEGREEMHVRLSRLSSIIHALEEPLQDEEAAMAQALCELATKIAEAVLHEQLKCSSDGLKEVIHDILSQIDYARGRVTLLMHPEDAGHVESGMRDMGIWRENFHIRQMDNISVGGCRIESDHAFVDATLESRLRDAIAALMVSPAAL